MLSSTCPVDFSGRGQLGAVAEFPPCGGHTTSPSGQTGGKRKPKPARYRTNNWFDDNAALRKHGTLLFWLGLDKKMAWHAPHEGRPVRPPSLTGRGPMAPKWLTPDSETAEIHIRIIHRLSHDSLQCPRHRRDRSHGMNMKDNRARRSQAAFLQHCPSSSPCAALLEKLQYLIARMKLASSTL
ncbi:MAG: hypothetical protein EA339_00425 [Rhodobacteraceae bacterium]|nr:MAG: hypothetical protein EA339_00425 [Paracoccaceae bacterium]